MNSLKAFCCAFLVVYSTLVIAQDSNKKWRLDGYIKEMISLTALQDVDSLMFDNLIHNRLNVFWYPTEKLTLNMEVRTRMFHGDAVKTIPSYGNFIDTNNDFFDFSYTEDFDQMVFHTMIDRLYLQWNDASWQLKVGRQRINWGVNLAWNPNDIFNAYSLYDFDYEERPGTDALRRFMILTTKSVPVRMPSGFRNSLAMQEAMRLLLRLRITGMNLRQQPCISGM